MLFKQTQTNFQERKRMGTYKTFSKILNTYHYNVQATIAISTEQAVLCGSFINYQWISFIPVFAHVHFHFKGSQSGFYYFITSFYSNSNSLMQRYGLSLSAYCMHDPCLALCGV